MQSENQNYTMWMSTDKVFPHNKPNITDHNLGLLKEFYLTQQYKHYQDINTELGNHALGGINMHLSSLD
jgi:hypothetical protein